MRTLPSRARTAALLAAGVMLLTACGSGSPRSAAVAADGTSVGAQSAAGGQSAAGAVPAALNFTAATVDGSTIDGASLLTKPTVAWFWAPWCTICRAEAPDIAAAQAKFAGRVNFVGIAGLGPVGDMRRFVADTSVGAFPHVVDADGRIWSGFKVISQPSFAFIRPDGSIEMVSGSLNPADLDAHLAGLASA